MEDGPSGLRVCGLMCLDLMAICGGTAEFHKKNFFGLVGDVAVEDLGFLDVLERSPRPRPDRPEPRPLTVAACGGNVVTSGARGRGRSVDRRGGDGVGERSWDWDTDVGRSGGEGRGGLAGDGAGTGAGAMSGGGAGRERREEELRSASMSRIIFVWRFVASRSWVALSARSLSSFSFVRVASVILAPRRVSREDTFESMSWRSSVLLLSTKDLREASCVCCSATIRCMDSSWASVAAWRVCSAWRYFCCNAAL